MEHRPWLEAARGPEYRTPRGFAFFPLLGLAVALLVAASSSAEAQVLRGRLVSAQTRLPMVDATVEALDSLSRPLGRTRSDSAGRFILAFGAGGDFRLRIRRLGIESTLTDPMRFALGDTLDVDLLVDEAPVSIGEVVVREDAQSRPLNQRRLADARSRGWRVIPPERVIPARERANQLDQLLRSLTLANVMISANCLRSLVTNGCLTVFVDDMYFGQTGFNAINPRDIEFVAVIGPTEALTAYGNRARHGVLMIYTSRAEDRTRRREP